MLDLSSNNESILPLIDEMSDENPLLADRATELSANFSSNSELSLLGESAYLEIVGTLGRDTLEGTDANERLRGDFGADLLTSGEGEDIFVYENIRDAGDTITDFEIGLDKIDLTVVLNSFGYSGDDPLADGYVDIIAAGDGSRVLLDSDGTGDLRARPYIFVENILPLNLKKPRNH